MAPNNLNIQKGHLTSTICQPKRQTKVKSSMKWGPVGPTSELRWPFTDRMSSICLDFYSSRSLHPCISFSTNWLFQCSGRFTLKWGPSPLRNHLFFKDTPSLRSVMGCLRWFSHWFLFHGSFGPFSLDKQAGKINPKNHRNSPRFSRELFDQNPLRENSALIVSVLFWTVWGEVGRAPPHLSLPCLPFLFSLSYS